MSQEKKESIRQIREAVSSDQAGGVDAVKVNTAATPSASAEVQVGKGFVNLDEIGVRKVAMLREQPVTIREQGMTKIVDHRIQRVEMTHRQPVLSTEEALKLGPQNWRPFSRMKGYYTCVINFRRFLIGPAVAEKLGLNSKIIEV
jgi:hypothetical protein